MYDGDTEFLVRERLPPIMFEVKADNFTQTINNTYRLEVFFEGFIGDIVNMESNLKWYPFNSKSVSKVTIGAFVHTSAKQGQKGAASSTIRIQFIINGFVFVHSKTDGLQHVSSKRSTGQRQNQTISNEEVLGSSFEDFFDHNMLLYLTFWGTEKVEAVLDEIGLVDPVVKSVTVGEKKLIDLAVDKDDNYKYKGDHDHFAGRSIPGVQTDRPKSSANVSTCGLLTIFMMSAWVLSWR